MTDTYHRRRKDIALALGWCACLALWTVALLTTAPAQLSKEVLPVSFHFSTSKGLHVGAYAFLAVYAAFLPAGRWRWLLLGLLSLHTAGTEFLQLFVPGRTGTVTDVLIDHVGLALGFALTWRRWLWRPGDRLAADSPRG